MLLRLIVTITWLEEEEMHKTQDVLVKNLMATYEEIHRKNGLNSIIDDLEEETKITRIALKNFFESSSVWKSPKQATGHLKYTHIITGVNIGFEGHGKDKDVHGSHAENLLEALNKHKKLFNSILVLNEDTLDPDFEATAIKLNPPKQAEVEAKASGNTNKAKKR